MATSFKILRRIGGAAGAPATLGEGELAHNDSGQAVAFTGDTPSLNDLWVGGDTAGTPEMIVSKNRQVETSGIQGDIQGKKNFRALSFGGIDGSAAALNQSVLMPSGDLDLVSDGQVMRIKASTGGTGIAKELEFYTPAGLTTVGADVEDMTGGTIEANFNAVLDWSIANPTLPPGAPLTISNGELWIFTDLESSQVYIWVGTTGDFGTGGTLATAADFSALGAATEYASRIEIEAGTITNKAINPARVADTMIVATNTDGVGGTDDAQSMQNSLILQGDNNDATAGGHGLTLQCNMEVEASNNIDLATGATININMNNNTITGLDDSTRFDTNFGKMTAGGTALLAVLDPTKATVFGNGNVNQLDNFVMDAGTF